MSKPMELAKLIEEFLRNTILGHESGFYKTFNISPNLLKTNSLHMLIDLAAANYLNQAYKSLIKDDDEYFMECFNNMANVMNHSHICLLNIMFIFLRMIHKSMNREIFDINTYDTYMQSVSKELERIINNERNKIVSSISHDCNGENIKDCDPNIDMFVITLDSK